MVHETSRKQHLSWLLQPLAAHHWTITSSFGEDRCPHTPSMLENQMDHLDFFLASWFQASVILVSFCPDLEPVMQIDFVWSRGCPISRGNIMSTVSLMDIETLWVIHFNWVCIRNSHCGSRLYIITRVQIISWQMFDQVSCNRLILTEWDDIAAVVRWDSLLCTGAVNSSCNQQIFCQHKPEGISWGFSPSINSSCPASLWDKQIGSH